MNEVNGVFDVLGVLGAYFSVVLVLAVTIETLLESIKYNKWLDEKFQTSKWLNFFDVQRRVISPDQAMRDIAYWVPPKSQAEVKIATLNQLIEQFEPALDHATQVADSSLTATRQMIQLSGLTRQEALLRTNLAQQLQFMRHQYSTLESARVARLRNISAIIGIVIAIIFQINTFAFLAPLFPATLVGWIDLPHVQLCGMLLTGFAASMGSAFWHTQAEKMRSVKESARSLQSLAHVG